MTARCRLPAPQRCGFTLIDVLITVVILGIIAAIVTPVLTSKADQAEEVSAHASYANVRKALDLYYQRYETWPEEITRDMFEGHEMVVMPFGYQLQYSSLSGELDLVELSPEDAPGAADILYLDEE